MEPQPLATLNQIFARLELLEDERWSTISIFEAKRLRLSSLDLGTGNAGGSGLQLLRLQGEAAIPFADCSGLLRPEVFFHPLRPQFDTRMLECNVERLLAPGDAEAFACPKNMVAQIMTTMATALGTTGNLLQGGSGRKDDGNSGGRGWDRIHFRMVVRRDFPRQGLHAVATAPRVGGSRQLLEEWGPFLATVVCLQPLPSDPGRTLVTQIRQVSRNIPNWAVALGAPRFFLSQLDHFTGICVLPGFQETVLPDATYNVISLRKCTKGPPLLPPVGAMESANEWVPGVREDGTRMLLAEYLHLLLARCGRELQVFDSLDGRKLVPYQAAVQQCSLVQAWPVLQGALKRQRAEYRRFHGGSGAPELTAGSEPRFLKHSFEEPSAEASPREAEEESLPVRGTFLHFGPTGRARTRSDSMPQKATEAPG